MNRRNAALAGLLLAVSGTSAAIVRSPGPGAGKPAIGRFGVDLSGMDRTVRPGDDFWLYVNGHWAKNAVIAPDHVTQGPVTELADRASEQVRAMLDDLAARRTALKGDERRAADIWTSMTDRRAIDARGVGPLLDEIAPARSAADKSELAREMGRLLTGWSDTPFLGRVPRYAPAPFIVAIAQDRKQPWRYVPVLRQGGLGMPDRDYYLKGDASALLVQSAYRAHLATMLALTGVQANQAKARAASVYEFERRLAEGYWARIASRDAEKSYNAMSPKELEALAPGFDWTAFLMGLGLQGRDRLIVAEPSSFANAARAYSGTPISVLKDWLAIRLAKDRAAVLPDAFGRAEYAFSSGSLGGSAKAPERSVQAAELTSVAVTDAVSKPYVERNFSATTKAAVERLVANVKTAMDRRMATLDWMGPPARARARAKLAALQVSVGYPDGWRSYEGLRTDAADAYGNLRRAAEFDYRFRLGRIDRPADRREWNIWPMTANAVANNVNGQILFAAAYLRPPHFDPSADPAVNYGALGAVIGHELSHHFDNRGARYDAEGRLANWWTAKDLRAFEARTQQLVDQYDRYEALPGLHIRGAQTLSENIADVSGMAIAYDAYKLALHGRPAPVIAGFTGDQRFFLARAQSFRTIFRDEELRKGVISGNYAPSHYRAWSVRNSDAWYRAFSVKPGERMYLPPDQRVRIW